MKKQLYLTLAIILLSISIASCRPAPRLPTETPTPGLTPLPALPTDEPTLIIATITSAPPEKKPTDTPAPVIPGTFTILLEFDADTVCGGDPFAFEYQVTVSGDTISLLQLNAGITSTGPYSAASGEFSASISGLPGTETYTGTLSASFDEAGQTAINMEGLYGYGEDPNFCDGNTSSQEFTGTTTP